MKLKISFIGSSLVSSYWNGAATYYRGIIKSMHRLGHDITFYEPNAYQRQENRDISDPSYARVVVYQPTSEEVNRIAKEAAKADIVIKASGVGVFDEELERLVLENRVLGQRVIFWDVDAPATLERIGATEEDPFRQLIPEYDLILTYGGGDPVVNSYKSFGAVECIPVYNALDPETHFPVEKDLSYAVDLAFLGNRLPDREQRVHHYFGEVAAKFPHMQFLLGGSGWESTDFTSNVMLKRHIPTEKHNAFNSSPMVLLNICRDSMARFGFSPATRVFEAAGAGACIITDDWEGIELFLEPGKEILVAKNAEEVSAILESLNPEKARAIGTAALKRILSEHTYNHRAKLLNEIISSKTHVSPVNV